MTHIPGARLSCFMGRHSGQARLGEHGYSTKASYPKTIYLERYLTKQIKALTGIPKSEYPSSLLARKITANTGHRKHCNILV